MFFYYILVPFLHRKQKQATGIKLLEPAYRPALKVRLDFTLDWTDPVTVNSATTLQELKF